MTKCLLGQAIEQLGLVAAPLHEAAPHLDDPSDRKATGVLRAMQVDGEQITQQVDAHAGAAVSAKHVHEAKAPLTARRVNSQHHTELLQCQDGRVLGLLGSQQASPCLMVRQALQFNRLMHILSLLNHLIAAQRAAVRERWWQAQRSQESNTPATERSSSSSSARFTLTVSFDEPGSVLLRFA
jgi:hypothetical protein